MVYHVGGRVSYRNQFKDLELTLTVIIPSLLLPHGQKIISNYIYLLKIDLKL